MQESRKLAMLLSLLLYRMVHSKKTEPKTKIKDKTDTERYTDKTTLQEELILKAGTFKLEQWGQLDCAESWSTSTACWSPEFHSESQSNGHCQDSGRVPEQH